VWFLASLKNTFVKFVSYINNLSKDKELYRVYILCDIYRKFKTIYSKMNQTRYKITKIV